MITTDADYLAAIRAVEQSRFPSPALVVAIRGFEVRKMLWEDLRRIVRG